jgi:hypothetical protein
MSDKRGIGTLVCDDVEMTTGNFDLFTPIVPENVLRNGITIELNPINSITSSGPYEFSIPRDPDHYIYLPLSRLYGTVEVVKLDGTPLTATENTSICNLFPQSLFKQMEIEIEGTQINDISSSTYAIKAYLETILSFGSEAKATHLQMAGWLGDSQGKENDITADSWKKRQLNILGKEYFFSMLLHCDFFQMERFLLPNTGFTLKLIRNADSYSFIAEDLKAKIIIKNLRLSIHKIKIAPDFDKSIESNLAKEPALYPLTQSKIKSFLLQTGTSSTFVQSVLSGSLPQSMIICFLDAKAFNGDVTANPFVFQNFNLNLLNLRINGNPFHSRPFTPNYTTGDYIREYRNLFDHGGCQHSNNCINIGFKEFKTNSNFYLFDFTPDLCNSFHHHATKHGHIDVELGWSTPLASNIYMIIYSSHKQTLVIDGNRNVSLLE